MTDQRDNKIGAISGACSHTPNSSDFSERLRNFGGHNVDKTGIVMTVADQRPSALNAEAETPAVTRYWSRNDMEPDRGSVIIEFMERNARFASEIDESCCKKSEGNDEKHRYSPFVLDGKESAHKCGDHHQRCKNGADRCK